MNEHTLRILEFDKIREFLASFATSEGAKRRCRSLVPVTDHERIQQLLDETTEMRREIDEQGRLPLSGIHDIASSVERSRIQNFFLEPKVLAAICETLETAGMLKKYFSGSADIRPLLFRRTSEIFQTDHVIEKIRKCISRQGEILDTASPALHDIRSKIRQLRRSIIKTLENMLHDEQRAYAIQDDFITLRNNRYVIPVRSDSKTAVPGVVHGQSQSKATFFIEPLPVVEMNNELQMLHRDEYYEEIRILTELTSLIAANSDAIAHNIDIAETIDLIHARALFSKALDAVPALLNNDSSITLLKCRHPMLLARRIEPEPQSPGQSPVPDAVYWSFDRPGVVPIDIVKKSFISTLVITGANAGGKTVAMKTLGLFVLMTQAGMHIPAAPGSALPVFKRIFADIGDEQNIEANLSTFSSHMQQIKGIVKEAQKDSLVLLDELGSGTDPSEGGALAVAILDFLRSRQCTTVVTTHLNLLKTYAYGTEDVENVSVAFDPATFKPLYTLVYGVPGFSNAIAIASTIGLPDEIIAKAREYLDGSDRQTTELIHGLEKTYNALIAQRQRFSTILEHTVRYQVTLERFLESIKHRKEKILKSFEAAARKLLRDSESELTKLIREQKRRKLICPEIDFKSDNAPKEILSSIKQRLYEQFPISTVPSVQPVESLTPGQTVTVTHLKQDGTVISADNDSRTAVVAVGSIRIKASFTELSLSQHPQCKKRKETAPHIKAEAHSTDSQSFSGQARINVIGLRVDEAIPLVDKAIDNALMQGVTLLEIIHGKGTGRLMQAIHEHLKGNEFIAGFEHAPSHEGGMGITRVHIK